MFNPKSNSLREVGGKEGNKGLKQVEDAKRDMKLNILRMEMTI